MRNAFFHNMQNIKQFDKNDYTDYHRKKIAAYYGSMYFLIMSFAGVILVASGAFAPFGGTLMGAIYLAGSLGLSSAVVAAWRAYSYAKNNPTFISKKDQQNITTSTFGVIGVIVGASLGAILTVAGYLVAAPTIVSAIAISFVFGWTFGILSLVLAKKYGNVATQVSPHNAQVHVIQSGSELNSQKRIFRDVDIWVSPFPPVVDIDAFKDPYDFEDSKNRVTNTVKEEVKNCKVSPFQPVVDIDAIEDPNDFEDFKNGVTNTVEEEVKSCKVSP